MNGENGMREGINFDFDFNTEIRKIFLRTFEIGGKVRVGDESFLQGVNVEVVRDHVIGDMVVSWRRFLYGKEWVEESVAVPKTWWDAVKERWFPGWLKKRFPVQFKQYELKRMSVCPHMNLLPRHPQHALYASSREISQGADALRSSIEEEIAQWIEGHLCSEERSTASLECVAKMIRERYYRKA